MDRLTTSLLATRRTLIGAMPYTASITMNMMICTPVTHTVKYGLHNNNNNDNDERFVYSAPYSPIRHAEATRITAV